MSNENEEVAVVEEVAGADSVEESEETSSPEASPKGKLNNKLLAAMEDQLNGLTLDPQAFVRSLPPSVKRRVKALKKLQMDYVTIESKFYEELHELEFKYLTKYTTVQDRRANIVSGEVEPTDSECEWPSEDEDETANESPEGGDTKIGNSVNSPDIKGMPGFWLTVLQHVGEVAELIQPHDEAILQSLVDVRLVLSGPSEPISFTIEFHFLANEYFTNTVLTKKYYMKTTPDANEINYEGPEIYQCEGTTVDWKQGKNVTVKTIKKKQKHKKSGVQRTVSKTVPNESFFTFFSPPTLEEQADPPTEELEAFTQSDFELGHFFREQIIPRAVLYFTGEACEDASDDEDYDDEDEADDDDDDEDEMLEGGGPPAAHHHKGRGRGGHKAALENGAEGKPECKQQ